MKISEVLKLVDHTYLAQNATYDDIKRLCDEGMKYKTASVCISPYYVTFAKQYTNGSLPICTVIGFPNGYSRTKVKVTETEQAISDGADEIDMVLNICMLKNKEYNKITDEIAQIRKVCGTKVLKVIIETCLLTKDEKLEMCKIVTETGADYIKTSTGFSSGGATFEDVELFARNVGEAVKIKASGGIQTLDDAVMFIELGASRLGTSRIVGIANKMDTGGY